MKRFILLITAAALVLALAACSANAELSGSNGRAGETGGNFRGNVSTTHDGRINGTNSTLGGTTGQTGVSNATGTGMQGQP